MELTYTQHEHHTLRYFVLYPVTNPVKSSANSVFLQQILKASVTLATTKKPL